MQRFALPLLLFLVGCAIAAPGNEKRIVGGVDANAHPYIASIRNKLIGWGHWCGGVIISKTWILTAAHCVYDWTKTISLPTELSVEVGSNHRNMSDQQIGVSKIIYHKVFQYAQKGLDSCGALGTLCNDIAALKLERPIELNDNVAIAKMAPEGSSFVNTTCVMSGWGRWHHGGYPSHLQEVEIPVITNTECAVRSEYTTIIGPGHICTFDKNHMTDTCKGDSGGPMMCGENHKLLAGLTSFGHADCAGNVPGVFTRVTYYLDWIKQITGVEP